MSSIWPGIKIWLITIFLNAVLWGVIASWEKDLSGMLLAIIFLFGGYFVTSPLLLLIVPIVQISRKLPYSISGKIAWIGFWLSLVIIGFVALVVWLFNGRFFGYDFLGYSLSGVAILALIISIRISRTTLIKLNTQS